ncbi:MAG: hypothetical protein M1838_004861 [Thelocarpon superellum]|nr:MAG: hypothetical protein M1838_004861 [Thelocarpon superellum]
MQLLLPSVVWFIVACAASVVPSSRYELLPASPLLNLRDEAAARDVFLILDHTLKDFVDPDTGERQLIAHAELHITGTSADGPLRISVSQIDNTFFAKVMDWTTANSNQPLGANSKAYQTRKIVELGRTGVGNAAIFDPNTGTGLVLDIIRTHFEEGYASGVRGCIAFARFMSTSLGLTIPEATETYLEDVQSILSRSFWRFSQETLPVAHQRLTGWKDPSNPPEKTWFAQAVDDQGQITLKQAEGPWDTDGTPLLTDQDSAWGQWVAEEFSDEKSIGFDPDPVLEPWGEIAPNQQSLSSELSKLHQANPSLSASDDESMSATPEQVPLQDMLPDRGVAMVRTGNSLVNVPLYSTELVVGITKAVGVVAAVVGPAFIILDLVQHNWVGAAFGIAGLVATVAATLALAGPLGWFVAGLVTALFALLPGMVNYKAPPPITDEVKIIQYSMFGDMDHTGNEKCQSMGNANCTAVYGIGVISSIFRWNEFDAAAFVIQNNQGYPMSIPDLARAFVAVKNSDGTTGAAAQSSSVINCPYHPPLRYEQGRPGYAQECNNPQYIFKRNMVTLPIINQTADKIFSRMIPNPGGDCRIVNDAANALTYPSINVTVHGMPVAIACNITAGLRLGDSSTDPFSIGSANGANSTSSSSSANSTVEGASPLVSQGNASTDGLAGHHIPATPPSPFTGLGPTSGLCMQDTQGGSTCLANGTYSLASGVWGFTFKQLHTLTLPTGGIMSFTRSDPNNGNRPIQVNVEHNVTLSTPPVPPPPLPHGFGRAPNKVSDQGNLTALAASNGAFDVLLPPPLAALPWVCLFSDINLQGDAACFGPGGGPLPSVVQNASRSMSVRGGATAWIYAQAYGDVGGVEVDGDIQDLGQEVYGVDGSFDRRIVALWIHGAGTGPSTS